MPAKTREDDQQAFDAASADELYGMPGHLIRRMHQASVAIFDAEISAAGFDLTSLQFASLTMIANHPGLDQATLASALAFDRATTGGVIDRLEAKGLVRREIDKNDRRARRLYIEPLGKTVLDNTTPVVRETQHIILGGLSEKERTIFLRLLAKALKGTDFVSRQIVKPQPALKAAE